MNISPDVNIPVRSLQTYLRTIAKADPNMPSVIPDGIFGAGTRNAVISFQRSHLLPVSGTVNSATWDKITEAYRSAALSLAAPRKASLYPSRTYIIEKGQSDSCVCIIQAMLISLCRMFPNIGHMTFTGVCDDQMRECVQKLQQCFGTEPTGTVDKTFWDQLSVLCEAFR